MDLLFALFVLSTLVALVIVALERFATARADPPPAAPSPEPQMLVSDPPPATRTHRRAPSTTWRGARTIKTNALYLHDFLRCSSPATLRPLTRPRGKHTAR